MSVGASAIFRADWPAPSGVVAFTTLRHGAGVSQPPFDHFNMGSRAGDDPDAVARNRAELIARFDLPSSPCWLRQVHGITVHHAEALLPLPLAGEGWSEGAAIRQEHPHPRPGHLLSFAHPSGAAAGEGLSTDHEPEADAAVTSTPGAVLAILTADCMPVLFAAADGSEIGAAHAGWRGLSAGVLEATLAAMRTSPERVIAWLGPAAGAEAYEVGEEVFAAFVSRDPRAESAFASTRPGHWRVDLYALARQRLATAGVDRIHGGGLCTISDPQRFFSHRRDQRSGRMATLAWMRP